MNLRLKLGFELSNLFTSAGVGTAETVDGGDKGGCDSEKSEGIHWREMEKGVVGNSGTVE